MTKGFGVVAGASSTCLHNQQVCAALRIETTHISHRVGQGFAPILQRSTPTRVTIATEGEPDLSPSDVSWVAHELSAQESTL